VSHEPDAPSALEVLGLLEQQFPSLSHLRGKGGWIVGGAIRDVLLAREAGDVDLVFENAEKVAHTFATAVRSRPIVLGRPGVEARRVVSGGKTYDFAELTRGSIEADLSRRDFTLNAIALSLDDVELLDPFHGAVDIRASLVRHIERRNFADDPLRTLKGVRMAVTLGFSLESATLEAIRMHAPMLQEMAAERVVAELRLIAAGDWVRGVGLLQETALVDSLELQIADGTIDRLRRLGQTDSTTALAAVMAGLSEVAINRFVERWKLSHAERQAFITQRGLFSRMSSGDLDDDCPLRIAVHDAGAEEAKRFAAIARAEALPRSTAWSSLVETELATILQCDGFLRGDELRAQFGFEGEEIGRWKRRLLERQICNLTTSRDEAIAFIESAIS